MFETVEAKPVSRLGRVVSGVSGVGEVALHG